MSCNAQILANVFFAMIQYAMIVDNDSKMHVHDEQWKRMRIHTKPVSETCKKILLKKKYEHCSEEKCVAVYQID
jgi:hypothetical protein